jgi:UDP-N-acetylmuramyl pentapeptide phosphotransferase/UDP-N-acetylglucosamine-1-phosphate transferase
MFIDVFSRGKSLAKNYRGELIPSGIGIVFILYSLVWYTLYLLLFNFHLILNTPSIFNVLIVMLAFFAASLIGFIDDVLGSRDTLGIKGHFKALFAGRLTTGAIKAIVGLLVSFVVSVFLSTGITELFINTLVIALFTNLLNLLDLRPGRAIKFYIFLLTVFLVLAALKGKHSVFLPFIPLIGSVLGYFPFDLKAKCMMGDAGSNVLGISAGILAVLQLGLYEKFIALILLVAVHIFAEKYSLSDVIKRNRILNFLDNLGRQI